MLEEPINFHVSSQYHKAISIRKLETSQTARLPQIGDFGTLLLHSGGRLTPPIPVLA